MMEVCRWDDLGQRKYFQGAAEHSHLRTLLTSKSFVIFTRGMGRSGFKAPAAWGGAAAARAECGISVPKSSADVTAAPSSTSRLLACITVHWRLLMLLI